MNLILIYSTTSHGVVRLLTHRSRAGEAFETTAEGITTGDACCAVSGTHGLRIARCSFIAASDILIAFPGTVSRNSLLNLPAGNRVIQGAPPTNGS